MKISDLTQDKHNLWDKFCIESDDAWFWHKSDWIEYTLNYDPKTKSKNYSFFITEDGRTLTICPLILEIKDGIAEFSFGGNYTPIPAFRNDLDNNKKSKITKEIFKIIDDLAKKNNVRVAKFKSVTLDKNSLNRSSYLNYLLKFGFLDVSIATQIINLTLSLEDLKKDIRHGHKSDVTKAQKNLRFEIYDKDNVDEKVFREYQKAKIKQGSIRSSQTFDLMLDFIRKGEAFLTAAKFQRRIISFSYFFVYKGNAYYGSSVNLEENQNLVAAHGIQWQAIQYMKEIGVNFYEIGWQVFSPGLNDFSSEKEMAISRFKRGFGGETVPLFMGEKYYDKELLEKVWKKRLKNLVNSYDK